jgi:hypothetical protein
MKIASPRDFLVYRKHFERDGTHFFIKASVVNDLVMPEQKGIIRGKVMLHAMVLDNPQAPRVRCIGHVDPGGSVPAVLLNKFGRKRQVAGMRKFRDQV